MTQVLNLESARTQVAEAIALRKKWGKFASIEDLPPEFMDAIVLVVEDLQSRVASDGNLAKQFVDMKAYADAEHEKLVLANRQLAAAKARETKLRQQLARVPVELENKP